MDTMADSRLQEHPDIFINSDEQAVALLTFRCSARLSGCRANPGAQCREGSSVHGASLLKKYLLVQSFRRHVGPLYGLGVVADSPSIKHTPMKSISSAPFLGLLI